MDDRKKVTVESPYKGSVKRNTLYAKRALFDSVKNHHEAPLASHMLYTQFLDDDDPYERQMGIECGLEWATQAELIVFYIDYGMSSGMLQAMEFAKEWNIPTELRTIGQNESGK